MKRWEDRSDVNRASYCGSTALFAGCVVVFLPKVIPASGFLNTLAQFFVMLFALIAAFICGIHLHRAFPDDLDRDF